MNVSLARGCSGQMGSAVMLQFEISNYRRAGRDRAARVHGRLILLAVFAFALGFLGGSTLVVNTLQPSPSEAPDLGWTVPSGWVVFAIAAGLWTAFVLQFAHVLRGMHERRSSPRADVGPVEPRRPRTPLRRPLRQTTVPEGASPLSRRATVNTHRP